MKIKSDFVTNSSSSSFVIIWPKKVKSIDDVSEYIKRKDFIPIIYNDIQNQPHKKLGMNILKGLAEFVSNGYNKDVFDRDKFDEDFKKYENIKSNKEFLKLIRYDHYWVAIQTANSNASMNYARKFIETHLKDGGYVYFFEYSDNDSEIFSALEHENDWGGLPGIRISHH